MRPKFTLTEDDRYSSLWKRLTEYLEARLDILRIQNDSDKDEVQTARLRGQIAELKVILALGEQKPPPD